MDGFNRDHNFPLMRRACYLYPLLAAISLATMSCNLGSQPLPPTPTPTSPPPPTSTTAPILFPADSDTPAAGICATFESEVVSLEIVLDVPAPRCAIVTADQRLEVVNRTGAAIGVRFAGYEFQLQDGEAHLIDAPMGAYLAPGVHNIRVTDNAGNAPELWLK